MEKSCQLIHMHITVSFNRKLLCPQPCFFSGHDWMTLLYWLGHGWLAKSECPTWASFQGWSQMISWVSSFSKAVIANYQNQSGLNKTEIYSELRGLKSDSKVSFCCVWWLPTICFAPCFLVATLQSLPLWPHGFVPVHLFVCVQIWPLLLRTPVTLDFRPL